MLQKFDKTQTSEVSKNWEVYQHPKTLTGHKRLKIRHFIKIFILFKLSIFSSINCSNLLSPTKEKDIPLIKLIDEIPEFNFQEIKIDSFEVDTAFVRNQNLHLFVSYTGKSISHEFEIYATGPVVYTNPPGSDLFLSHKAKNDTCTTETQQHLKFDLSPYAKYDEGEIRLFVNDYDGELFYAGIYKR